MTRTSSRTSAPSSTTTQTTPPAWVSARIANTVETYEGKLINAKGVKARYLRFYSKGSTESALNEYTEIEVYGRPAK